MKKVTQIFKGPWNGVTVRGYRLIESMKSEFKLYTHTDGADTVRFVKGKAPIIISSTDLAIEKLKMGMGVIYKDYVMFDIDINSDDHERFKKRFEEIKEEYATFLNGLVLNNIIDIYNFGLVKGLFTFLRVGIFSEEMVKEKLSKYLFPESVLSIVEEFKKELNIEEKISA